jgi:hypothetical protein
MRRPLQSVIDFWSSDPWVDYALLAVTMTAYIVITRFTRHGDWLRWIGEGQQLTVYGTGATVISIIGGFGAIAVSVYLSAGGERARAVRVRYSSELRRNWRAVILGLGFSAGACLIAQGIDATHDPFSSRFVFEAAVGFAVLRFFRLVWLFDAMVRVADQDLTDVPRADLPKLGASWRGRREN